jgi:hypothetical protein
MSNFQDLLDKKMDDIEKPKPLPVGSYICMVDGAPEITTIGQKQTDAIIFKMKVMQAGEDVNTDLLEEAGGVGNKTLRLTQFLTEDSLHRVKRFLNEHLEIDADLSVRAAIAEAPGRTCICVVKHRPSQDGQDLYAEIASTAKA